VELRAFPTRDCAAWHHRIGVAALLLRRDPGAAERIRNQLFPKGGRGGAAPVTLPLAAASELNSLARAFGGASPEHARKPAAGRSPGGLTLDELFVLDQLGPAPRRNREEIVLRVVLDALGPELPRGAAGFARAGEELRERAAAAAERVLGEVGALVRAAGTVVGLLEKAGREYGESLDDIRRQAEGLFRGRWWLEGRLADRVTDWQGLEARVQRMLGGPPAKDLAKLERWERDWGGKPDPAPCPCGEGHPTVEAAERREQEARARLAAFAPEFRSRRG
jgi:hypothetical protein